MEENKLTPEQEEMKVYEIYLETFGAEDVIRNTLDAIDDAEKCLRVVNSMMAIDGSPVDNPAVKEWAQTVIAQLQVMLNMVELVIGDTAEKECETIFNLSEIIYANDVM